MNSTVSETGNAAKKAAGLFKKPGKGQNKIPRTAAEETTPLFSGRFLRGMLWLLGGRHGIIN